MTTLTADLIRQGDVLLARIDSTASAFVAATPDADGSPTLAHGEVTGHRHRFERAAGPDGAALARIMVHPAAPDEPAVVELSAPQPLVHEEHTAHEIPRGTWRVSRPYEYTGAELRRVED